VFSWVTSNGIITNGISAFKRSTYSKAAGSKNILNYAAGVMFPLPIAPPIITILEIFYFISGYVSKIMQRFVKEPVFAQTTLPS
jgi:hypothetical protein